MATRRIGKVENNLENGTFKKNSKTFILRENNLVLFSCTKLLMQHFIEQGSGCNSVGRVVASNTRGQ